MLDQGFQAVQGLHGTDLGGQGFGQGTETFRKDSQDCFLQGFPLAFVQQLDEEGGLDHGLPPSQDGQERRIIISQAGHHLGHRRQVRQFLRRRLLDALPAAAQQDFRRLGGVGQRGPRHQSDVAGRQERLGRLRPHLDHHGADGDAGPLAAAGELQVARHAQVAPLPQHYREHLGDHAALQEDQHGVAGRFLLGSPFRVGRHLDDIQRRLCLAGEGRFQ